MSKLKMPSWKRSAINLSATTINAEPFQNIKTVEDTARHIFSVVVFTLGR